MRVWAICLGCADRKGRKLSGAWRGLLLWLAAIFVGLALATWVVGRLVRVGVRDGRWEGGRLPRPGLPTLRPARGDALVVVDLCVR